MSQTTTRVAAAAVAAGVAAILAGCGSTPAPGHGGTPAAAGISGPALATTVASPDGTDWATVDMGGSAAQHNNFWELFVRPSGTDSWKLATPVGAASNGGLVATAVGTGTLLSGFRPSQDLTFSPLASTTDAGLQWSQNSVLDAGLADVPTALAGNTGSGSAAGRVLALTDRGDVEVGTSLGSGWKRLTTAHALAASSAGRACGLTGLTAAAWTPAGAPLVAGDCSHDGKVGILTFSAGGWHTTSPAVPASLASGPVSVIGLNTTGTHTTSVLAVGTGAATSVLAAWSVNGGRNWALSQPLRTGPERNSAHAPSVSFGPDGSASLVLPSGRGVTIGWQAAAWETLPALPARTATLASASTGSIPEAVSLSGDGTLSLWRLAPAAGAAAGGHWQLAQTVKVPIPYGSSS
jgi:hypothetical protein